MCDLVAQITSSLLQFPAVTVEALGEDEIKLDSVLHGKFAAEKNGLAWLACGPQLEVVSSVTGERLSAYRFSGISENPPNVLTVKEFCWHKRTGLLVGLEEPEGSMLCLYDLGISRVVKAVVVPGRIVGIEPIINHGGASASTQHLHQSLRWFFGVAAVVTDVGHILLLDLCLDDLSCSQSELEASDLEVVNKSPAEIPRIRETVTREGRHLCLQLQSPSGTSATALQYISRTNQLAVGFSDGYLQLWNMKTLKKEYHSQLEGGRVPVYAFTFQEPENDPRNCCCLWAVQSSQDSEGDVVSLHLLQLAFGDRKCMPSGHTLYEGLEFCEERYSQDLTAGVFALRNRATNTRLLGCQTIEKFRNHPDRDENMNEASPDTSVSVFCWQVKLYGQDKPSTFLGIFDINRWYHAQMPDSLRHGEFLHSCPYFALWSLDAIEAVTFPTSLLDVLVHDRSLSRGVPHTHPPPEQFFNPGTFNFDAVCLLSSGIVHITCSGFQKETLSFLKKSYSCLNEAISDGYNRCLMAGLLSPRLADMHPSALNQEEQLGAILSTAVEASSLGLITGCIKQWTSEEQPGYAANLRFVLEWSWNKIVLAKEQLDKLCTSLFDGSCNFIDPQTIQILQHYQMVLCNLSTIFNCFLGEAQELTEKGLQELLSKHVVATLISQYVQVVLWFCRCGLLPETSADGDILQLSRPFYNYPLINDFYGSRRQKLKRLSRGKWNSDCLMIDGLVSQFGDRVVKLWKRDGGTEKYPPPTLHALLDIYLLENVDESAKHAIVIYLLLDIMYSSPKKMESSVESFPTAFAIPMGLVKLIQGFWQLDHNDHEDSLNRILHPSTCKSVLPWQHERIIQALMCQEEYKKALRYIQLVKPAMSSCSEIKLYITVLLFNRCMVEAWRLLRQHSSRPNVEELLNHMFETCQDLGLMEMLLKLPFTVSEQECLEKFLRTSGGQNLEMLMVHYLQRAHFVPALQLNQTLKMNLMYDRDPQLKERSHARNSMLDQYGKILPRVQRRLATERAKPYNHPSTFFWEVPRPKPLSTVAKPAASGNILTRATFINNVLLKVGEVWVGNELKTDLSPFKSPRIPQPPTPATPTRPTVEMPDVFVDTPIARTSKMVSRLLDLVVRPTTDALPEELNSLQSPPKVAPTQNAFDSGMSSSRKFYLKNNLLASELSLLQTPQVVKVARALCNSSTSGLPCFTPQSILRSSQRPTPVGSPSASTVRSLTPPLRLKESRITFLEDALSKNDQWSNGIVACKESILPSNTTLLNPSNAWSASSSESLLLPVNRSLVPDLQVDLDEGCAVTDVVPEEPFFRKEDTSKNLSMQLQEKTLLNEEILLNSEGKEPSEEEIEGCFDEAELRSPGKKYQEVNEERNMAEERKNFPKEKSGEGFERMAGEESNKDFPTQEDMCQAASVDSNNSASSPLEFHDDLFHGSKEEDVEILNFAASAKNAEHPQVASVMTKQSELESVHHDSFEKDFKIEEPSSEVAISPVKSSSETNVQLNKTTESDLSVQEEQKSSFTLCQAAVGLTLVNSEAATVDTQSVVSVNDSEDLGSTPSEPKAEGIAEIDLDSEAEIIEDNDVHLRTFHYDEKIISLEPEPVRDLLTVITHEINAQVVEDTEMECECLEDKADIVSYTELRPSDTLLIPLQFSSEEHFEGPLLPEKETNEIEPTVVRDELEMPPSNFTLVLEAEEEEPESSNCKLGENPLIIEVCKFENNVGAFTSENNSMKQMNQESLNLILPGTDSYDTHLNTTVNCPHFSEPSKENNVECLVNTVKNIKSEDFSIDLIQQVVPVETLVVSKEEIPAFSGIHSHSPNKQTMSAEEHISWRTRGRSVILVENSMVAQPERVSDDEQKTPVPPSLRKGRKQIKSVTDGENDEGKSSQPQDDISYISALRTTRSTKRHESEIAITPRRSLRRLSSATDETPKSILSKKGLGKSVVGVALTSLIEQTEEKEEVPVTPSRRTRQTRSKQAHSPEKAQPVALEGCESHSESIFISPTKPTRKSQIILAKDMQNIEQEEKNSQEQFLVTPGKRSKKSKVGTTGNIPSATMQSSVPMRVTRSRLSSLSLGTSNSPGFNFMALGDTPLASSAKSPSKVKFLDKIVKDSAPVIEMPVLSKVHKEITETTTDNRRSTRSTSGHNRSLLQSAIEVTKISSVHDAKTKKTLAVDATDIYTKHLKELHTVSESEQRVLQNIQSNKDTERQELPIEHFTFSPPNTRGRKTKAETIQSPEVPSSAKPSFAFSPPATRLRRTHTAVSKDASHVEVQDKLCKAIKEQLEEIPTASNQRRKKATRGKKEILWSPPPVEVNLISPIISPVSAPVEEQKKSDKAAVSVRINLRKNRKRLTEVIFPKPVTRRKML
ncbi:protein ELYS isoform X3 [Polypterus senegalus]|uniref:protein ELYS isoform X3 n=1 Tax=Polypterus senegalus TaxID=55291 RepID=UPI00196458C4|nr:protein ELYS isoform X3 [Polypterus senegalus]